METQITTTDLGISLDEMIKSGHYAKAFIKGKMIPEDQFQKLIGFIHSTASSCNVQATRYFVLSEQEDKDNFAGLFTKFKDNIPKLTTASHVIIAATMADLSNEYLTDITEREDKDGRFATPELKQRWDNIKHGWIDYHRYDLKDLFHWSEKQSYFAVGAILLAAAALGINSAPMEGFEVGEVDKYLGLREKGLSASVIMAFGYRDIPKDFAVNLPKSRLPKEEIFTFL